jgi:hypothetical protein
VPKRIHPPTSSSFRNFYEKLKQRLTIGQAIKIKEKIIQFEGEEEKCLRGREKQGRLGDG